MGIDTSPNLIKCYLHVGLYTKSLFIVLQTCYHYLFDVVFAVVSATLTLIALEGYSHISIAIFHHVNMQL